MNKLIEEKLVASLDEAQKWIESTKDFVAEQAPLVIQEVIAWGFYSHLFFASIFLLAIIIISSAWLYIRKFWKWDTWDTSYSESFPTGFLLNLVCVIGNLIFFLFLSESLYYMIYISVAPRLYVLEQLLNLVKEV